MKFQQTILIVFGLGLYHGINPAMGWLLAASTGLQAKSMGTLVRALCALTTGHIVAVGITIFGYRAIQKFIPDNVLQWAVASFLIGFGVYHLVKGGHSTWLGMRSNLAAVAFWSFCIATAHGAGLMLLPFIKDMETSTYSSILIIFFHTLGYLIMASAASIVLYWTLNLRLLKKTWINFDLFWAYSLLLTGVFFIFTLIFPAHRGPHSPILVPMNKNLIDEASKTL